MTKPSFVHGAREQEPDNAKLAELILYIAQRCEGDERFGAIKLNKILFYADFVHYLQYGRSITGQEYQKLENGPAPRHLKPVHRMLEKEKAIKVVERSYFGRRQKKTIALREANLSHFSGSEIAVVDRIIRSLWDMNATETSDVSHKFVGWQYAELNETIPYPAALLDRRPLTQEELNYGLELEASIQA